MRFRGIFTPLVTPIQPDEKPDLPSLDRLVDFQLASGVHGLWALGTSSEFASFNETERAAILEAILVANARRCPVIVNVSDASTRLTLRHARHAASLGADAIAATPPYYYPHSQDEVLAHYHAIRDAVDLPLFIYNIPQTVRVRVELPTAKTLMEEGTTAGIKDSQNDLDYFRQLALFARRRGLDVALFAGTRYLIDAGLLVGATGAIPSIANAFPDLCIGAYKAAEDGDFAGSARINDQLADIESITGITRLGSRNAAILGFQKAILHDRGIIAYPCLTSPLRTLDVEERRAMLGRLEALAASAIT